MKRLTAKVLFLLFVLMFMATPVYAKTSKKPVVQPPPPPTIVVDGKILYCDVPPVRINNRILVPIKPIIEALNADFTWHGEEQRLICFRGVYSLDLKIGATTADIIGYQTANLDVPARIIQGRTFVPIRTVGEGLGCEVEWIAEKNVVKITSKKLSPVQDVADLLSPIVVLITTDKGAGTGFFWTSSGEIVTNAHVVEGANWIKVKTGDQKEYDATLLIEDSYFDLARIKIEGDGFPCFQWYETTQEVNVGDTAIAIGNPFGLENTVSAGNISAKREFDDITVYQITTPLSPGNSGSPLFSEHGEVIAINTASITEGQNLNFAIPVDYVYEMVHRPAPGSAKEIAKLSDKVKADLQKKFGSVTIGDTKIKCESVDFTIFSDLTKFFNVTLNKENYSKLCSVAEGGNQAEAEKWLQDIYQEAAGYYPGKDVAIGVTYVDAFYSKPDTPFEVQYVDGKWIIHHLGAVATDDNGFKVEWLLEPESDTANEQ